MQIITHKESKLVCILARSGNPDSARPVVVQVTQFVGQLLQVIWGEARVIPDHIIGRWVDSALSHTLGHKEKIIPGKY